MHRNPGSIATLVTASIFRFELVASIFQKHQHQGCCEQISIHASRESFASFYGDTQWNFFTTRPSFPNDTDQASISSASRFSNHNLSTQGIWHFVEAYRRNGFSGVSRTDGIPNWAITNSAVSPILTESYDDWRFVRT
jgi:hypothetical protein